MKKRDPKKQKGGFRRKDQQAPAAPEIENQGMRLNKFVAHSGICSRRQAAELVKAGKIKVNGNVVLEPFYLVQKEDKVEYEGKQLLLEEKKVYLLLNKPKDYITTLSDDRGRKTVMDLIDPNIKERIYPVGRLDRATTGLLLLTNDGELAQKLAHPSHEIKKFYHVRLDKPVSQQDIDKIAAGLQLEDGPAPVNGVDYIRGKGKKRSRDRNPHRSEPDRSTHFRTPGLYRYPTGSNLLCRLNQERSSARPIPPLNRPGGDHVETFPVIFNYSPALRSGESIPFRLLSDYKWPSAAIEKH
jgi:pseudouridine synthase